MNPPNKREATKQEKMAADILPPELWTLIFLRLPVRTLLFLKCLCKLFFSLIDNPNFARNHFELFNNEFRGENDTRLILIERPIEVGVLRGTQFVTRYGDELIETTKFKMPIDWGYTIEVIGCVDGLLCLHKFKSCEKWLSTEMILWNPSIGKALIITPSPDSLEFELGSWAVLGFGYNPVNDDYQVVAVVQNGGGILVEIYSVRRGLWKMTESENYGLADHHCLGNTVYLDGVIYWIAEYIDYDKQHMISFDLKVDETWGFDLPLIEGEISPEKSRVKVLVVVDRSVVLFSISPNRTLVWVLDPKDNSWTKVSEMDSKQEWFDFLRVRHVSNAILFKDSCELLVSVHGPGVVSYSYKTHKITSHNHGAIYVGIYAECLLWKELLPQSNPNGEAMELMKNSSSQSSKASSYSCI